MSRLLLGVTALSLSILAMTHTGASSVEIDADLPTAGFQRGTAPLEEASNPTPGGAADLLDAMPLTFVRNDGQWDTPAKFVGERGGMVMRLERDAVLLQLETRTADESEQGLLVRFAFEGASPLATLGGEGEPSRICNYFRGHDPAEWRTGVPAHEQVVYRDLYEGIDVRIEEHARGFKYDVRVAPGADLGRLVIRCDGVEGLAIEADGTLRMDSALGPIRHEVPATWHELPSGERQPVICAYRLLDANRYTLEVDARDASLPLVIDPLVWSTFVGGTGTDIVTKLALTSGSDVIIVGFTTPLGATPFPTTAGTYAPDPQGLTDAFVARLSADGSALPVSTFLGGDSHDVSMDVAVSPTSGEVTVSGKTYSEDFPTTAGAYDTSFNTAADAFVARLDATLGSLLYATFLGGISNDWAASLALDPQSDEVVLAGYTYGSGFPTTPGAYDESYNGGPRDAFVARLRLNAAGTDDLVFSTFLGGTGWEGYAPAIPSRPEEATIDLALDLLGRPTVTGVTGATNFPTTVGGYDTSHNGSGDVFVARLNAAGSDLDYGTFVGSDDWEAPLAIAVDGFGLAVVGGFTYSPGFPTTPGAYDTSHNGGAGYNDAFVVRLDATGSSLLYSTFLGGSEYESVDDLALHAGGDVVVTGFCGPGFPMTSGSYDPFFNGAQDVYVTRLRMDGHGPDDLIYSTFAGGSSWESGEGLAMDGEAAIVGGLTQSTNFPTTPGAFDETYNGNVTEADGFVLRLSPLTTGIDQTAAELTSQPPVMLREVLPNPTLGRVSYRIQLRVDARVRVNVFDTQGRLVEKLIDAWLPAGAHHFLWDPSASHDKLASGTYYLQLDAGEVQQSRKVVLVQ